MRNLANLLRRAASALALALLPLCMAAQAQAPNPSFVLLGYLQELNVANLNDPLSAGSMVVNGVKVTLPRNIYITMPGFYLTPADLFRGKHPGSAGTGLAAPARPSGLALKDANRPPVPFEVEVIGNIVGGEYIAGVVRMTQQGLNVGTGYIRSIDYAKGELLVGPDTGGPPVARVRINDPEGVYGRRNADKVGGRAFDERFGVDPGNASIVAMTGFPMCIPRVAPPAIDPRCPLTNRLPANSVVQGEGRRFTCGPVAAEPTAPAHWPAQADQRCRPTRPAPFMVGDYIEFSGMVTEDSPGSRTFFLAAHAILALAGIYTSPGVDPAYLVTEVGLVGTLGDPWPDIDQEETSRFRIVAFTTDPSRRVDVTVIDNDGTARNPPLAILDPSRVAQIGRVRVTLPAKSNFLPVARDIHLRVHPAPGNVAQLPPDPLPDNGLAKGEYTSPVSEYIFPENTRFGRPRSPVGVPFESFCFLNNGGEPLSTLGRNGPAIGRLAPFPDSGHAQPQSQADGVPACPPR